MKAFLRSGVVKRDHHCLPRCFPSLVLLIFLLASIGILGNGAFLSPTAAEAQIAQKPILDRHHPLVREAIQTKNRHMGNLMRIPDVVGTGVGIGPDGLPAIKVFTARHGVRGIPEWLESTPVQVEVTGMAVALQDPWTRFDRPVPIGVSTGHPLITAGTIGARVIDANGNVYALSNNHVYANSNKAKIGDSALQPGPFDYGTDPADKIGELYAFQPINFSIFGSNTIDAAIASTTPGELGTDTLPAPAGYGTPNRLIFGDSNKDGFFDNEYDLLQQPAVKKFGRTTGLTHGQITEINVTITVCYANCSSRFSAKLAWFDDQIGISNINTPFSQGGDSGSLIVTDDPNNNPVGLLFAGSNTRTYANRIDLVLNHFGVKIDDGSEPPPPPPPQPPAAPTNLKATAVSRTQINLTWTDNSNNEEVFKIERCQGSGCTNFVQIATVGADVKSYPNTGLSRNTTYRYRVRAYNVKGDSDYSNIATAKTRN